MMKSKRLSFRLPAVLAAVVLAGAATADAQCAAPACPAANCFVDPAQITDDTNCACGSILTACDTIQRAIDIASPGDVIEVAAGTYPEAAAGPLTINKTLTLCGAQDGVDARSRVGSETVVTDPQGTYVTASNVVINGFTIQDVNQSAQTFTGYGILMGAGGAGTTGTQVLNNVFQNNTVGVGLANTGGSQVVICQNLFQNNNLPGSASGTGIYTDQFVCGIAAALACTNFLIEQNAFEGNDSSGIDISNTDATAVSNVEISTNTFNNGRALLLFNADMVSIHNNDITNANFAVPGSGAIRIFGGADDVSITNNNLDGGNGWAIRLSNTIGPSSNVVIQQNNIANFLGDGGLYSGGLFVGTGAHTGPVDATCNWWDDPCGPLNVAANPAGIGEEVREEGAPGDASFISWLPAPGPAPGAGQGACTGAVCMATTTTTSTTSTTIPADHFKCYKTRTEPFARRNVTLVDQFVTSTATVIRPVRLCNPADKNGEGIVDPTAHLMCYKIREGSFARRDALVRNQFGDQTVTVVRPESLCNPADKDGIPRQTNGNHFKCYRVRAPGFTTLTANVTDQFETQTTTLVKLRLLCNPVDKNGEGMVDPQAHLACYTIGAGGASFTPRDVTVTDQFSQQDLSALQGECRTRSLLCVPSQKNPL